MAKAGLKMMTANRLSDGEAVWLDRGGEWVASFAEAAIVESEGELLAFQERADRGVAANRVVSTELIDIDMVDGRPVPRRLRERIRALGPTTHPGLGKQAGGRVDLPAIAKAG